MRVLKVPENGPKRKLLDAAELLVSEKGFDLVSVRDVTGAVEANVAAVNYHFGSREGLMELLVMRLLGPLCEERVKALEHAESQRGGKMAAVGEITAAYTDALQATADRLGMDTGYFLKLAGRILVLTDQALSPQQASLRGDVRDRFLAALARALPETASTELSAGWRFFDYGLSQSLVTLAPGEDAEALIVHWTNFGTKGFGGAKPAKDAKKDDSQGMLFDL